MWRVAKLNPKSEMAGMLRFDVHPDASSTADVSLEGAYAFGQDGIPIRADLAADDGQLLCVKRVPGACGVGLVWPAGEVGRFLLPTTRLPERREPYALRVELARAQMARVAQKREEWGLFDYGGAAELNEQFAAVRGQFLAALTAADPAEAARRADRALRDGLALGERMALFHADILLARRKERAAQTFGCTADLSAYADAYLQRLFGCADFVHVPTPWKRIEPKEGTHEWEAIDRWMNTARRRRKGVTAGPLLSFEPAQLPEQLYLWEHDYDALRDVIYEHIQRVVHRYDRHVQVWNVVSGIHAHNNFNLTFEQLMELTRMSCRLVKTLAPQAKILIELAMPFGEFYARNQRTIPPLLYADMAVQSGVRFDAFGLPLCMGVGEDGLYVRDLLQISALLDEFVSLGKPVHVTACQVPSDVGPDAHDAWGGQKDPDQAGRWHGPWSERLQAEWLQAVCRIALSKPFVESVCWRDLADGQAHYLPHGGLCRRDLEPKAAYTELRNFRAALRGGRRGKSS